MEKIEICKIKPASYNPRHLSDEAFEQLTSSINALGFILPIIVNSDNMTIVAGHQRTKVCKKGSKIEIDNPLFKLRIENAAQLSIVPDFIDRSLPQCCNRLFITCRNWWFANMLAKIDDDIKRSWNGGSTESGLTSSRFRQLSLF